MPPSGIIVAKIVLDTKIDRMLVVLKIDIRYMSQEIVIRQLLIAGAVKRIACTYFKILPVNELVAPGQNKSLKLVPFIQDSAFPN